MSYQTADLTGKVAFITGASSGIGAEVARSLRAQGVKLALFSRSGSAPELPDTLQLRGDVGNRADVDAAIQTTVDTYGHLDIVVANAGVGSYGQFVDVPEQHEDEMIRTNVLGTIYVYRAAVPHLQAAGGGDLITVASEAGRRGLPATEQVQRGRSEVPTRDVGVAGSVPRAAQRLHQGCSSRAGDPAAPGAATSPAR